MSEPRDRFSSTGFSMGDDLAAADIHRPEQRRKRTSATPWVLLLVVTGLAAGAAAFFIPPLLTELREQKQKLAEQAKLLAANEAKLTVTEQTLQALIDKSTQLERTVEEQAVVLKELETTRTELEQKLQAEIASGDVGLKQVNGELVVDLIDQVLFASGETELNDKGQQVLKLVGETLAKSVSSTGRVIMVGGHTDDQPISDKLQKRFRSNWELSTERALNVVHFLQDQAGVPGEHLVAVGYGQYRPVSAGGATGAGAANGKDARRRLRRIELTVQDPPKSAKATSTQ